MLLHIATSTLRNKQASQPIASVTLPYVQGRAEHLRRVLSNLDICVTFRPQCTLRQLLVKPKDPVPPDHRKGVVYKIKDCSYSYIGQTGRSLSDRIKEHKRPVSRVNVDDSALAEHVANSGHEIDWCSAMILDSNRFFYLRRHLESWYIQKGRYVMNREVGPLPPVYCCLLNPTS